MNELEEGKIADYKTEPDDIDGSEPVLSGQFDSLNVIKDDVPTEEQDQGVAPKAIAEVLAHGYIEATAVLEEAQTAYAATGQAETLFAMGDGFSATLMCLDAGIKVLHEVREGVQAAEGALPVDIANLQKQIETLHTRAKVAQEAARAPSAVDGLIKIQEVLRMYGEDPTLAATRSLLRKEAAKDIETLKQRAQNDVQVGDFAAALDRLSQVRQLEPTDTETIKLYAELQQRQKLEEELRQIQRDVDSKIARNSPTDALRVLRYQGLTKLLAPNVAVSARVREILIRLIELGDRNDALALGNPEQWYEAQELMAALGNLRSESWAAQRAVEFVDQWIRLARDNALRGVVASTAALGDLLRSFCAAVDYFKSHPEEDFAYEQLATRRDALVAQLNKSAQKRLGHAQNALADGDHEIALHNLENIEEDIYGETDARFPGLLDDLHDVQTVRDEIKKVRAAAQKLQTLAENAQLKLDTAKQACLENQWDAAEFALNALPDLEDAPALNAQAEDLRGRIAKARLEAMRKRLHEALIRIETRSQLALTSEELDVCLWELQEVQAELDLHMLDVTERDRYFQLLSKVREQRDLLELGANVEQRLETYLSERQYYKALDAFDTALAIVRDPQKRVDLQVWRREIELVARAEHERALLLEQGESLFFEGKYAEARQQLEKASSQGADVKDLLRAARAGVLLQSAQRLWVEQHDGESALADLEVSHGFTENNPRATAIADEARRLQRRIEKASGENRGKVSELLERARRENAPEKALKLVELALELAPDSIDARLLQKELQSVAATEQIIVQLEQLANGGQFMEARARLTELATRGGVPSSKLREMQDLVGKLETEQWDRVIQPIQELCREGEYAEALNRGKLALKHTATPELQQELQSLQSAIVARWVETRSQALRKELKENPSEETLRDIEGQITMLRALEPAPEAQHQRQLADLLKDACTRRLNLRIERARARYTEWRAQGQGDSPQVALGLLKSVRDEAEVLGLQVEMDVTLKAAELEAEIRAAVQAQDVQLRKIKHDDLLRQIVVLRAQWENLEPTDTRIFGDVLLDNIEELAECILKIADYENDWQAREFVAWVQQERPLESRAQRFLKAAGFEVFRIEASSLYRCMPLSPNLKRLLSRTVYTHVLGNEVLDAQKVLAICKAVREIDPDNAVVLVITNQRPTTQGWAQIGTLRMDGITVLPLDETVVNKGLFSERAPQTLAQELEQRLGREYDPYDLRQPVAGAFAFFGRDSLVEHLLRRVSEGCPIGIWGLRKLGKSSMLHALRDRTLFPVALVNLQTIGALEIRYLYRRILGYWQQWVNHRYGLEWKSPESPMEGDGTGIFVAAALDLLERLTSLGNVARLGLFLDEAELFIPRFNGSGADVRRYLDFMRAIRGLVDEDGRLSIVMTSLNPSINRVSAWNGEQNPALNLFQDIYLPPLTDETCGQMVRNIGQQVDLVYDDDSVQSIVDLSGGHPFLARQFCSLLFRQRDRHPGEIGIADIPAAVEGFIHDEQTVAHIDTGIWQDAGNAALWGGEQAVVNQAILLEIASSSEPLSKKVLVDVPAGDMRQIALISLERYHFVYQPEPGYYALRFGLLRTWLRRRKLGLTE